MTPSELERFVSQFYPQGAQLVLVPYGYTLTFANLAAGATATQQLAITANSDFLHVQTSYHANLAAAVQNVAQVPVPLWRVLITDSGTNEQFTSAAMDLANYATKNAAGYCENHLYPRLIAGRSSLTVQVTSYEAAQATYCDIALNGVLVRVTG